MYQLTVDAAHDVSVTDHLDHAEAHGQLMRHVVGGDYYLRTVQTEPTHTTYELLVLSGNRHRPSSAGHAIIEDLTGAGILPVDSPASAAIAAQRWIAHHRLVWEYGSDTDPGAGLPLAVLTAARAEARFWFGAGLLLPEAAQLAGAGGVVPRPSQRRLEALRRSATAHPEHLDGDLAAVVVGQLENPPGAASVAALIWWYALLCWGASVP